MNREHERGFEEAFNAYSDELFRHAQVRLKSRERARDLTQDTFVRAWEYLTRGEEIHEFRPFLYRVLKNLIIDEYRKAKSESLEALVNTDEGETVDALLPPDETNTLEAAVARMDGIQALEALAQLPDSYREVLTFRYVNGLSPSEIAKIYEESENVISVRTHRALQKLKRILYPE